jgi:WD40 repeat protein
MFLDNPDQFRIYPYHTLPAENHLHNWHTEDILSVVFCPPNTVATSGYDGKIIITNIHSGHVLHVMEPSMEEMKIFSSKSIDKSNF